MRFKNLDLNLLVALDALLTERSVTAAGARLNLSQSAMSAALARLRAHFQDELLTKVGRTMVRTAFGEDMASRIKDLLQHIESTTGIGARFDPTISKRRFTILASDYVMDVLLTDVVRVVASKAPNVELHLGYLLDEPASVIEQGSIDLLIVPDVMSSPEHPSTLVFEDEQVVVGWADGEALSEPLTLERFFELGHVVARFAGARRVSIAEIYMRTLAHDRRVEVVAPSFAAVPGMLIGANRISLMHRRHAEAAAERMPLKIVPPPFNMPPVREVMQFNRVRENDIGLAWLQNEIIACATSFKKTPVLQPLASFAPIEASA